MEREGIASVSVESSDGSAGYGSMPQYWPNTASSCLSAILYFYYLCQFDAYLQKFNRPITISYAPSC
ncbi:hypothetical protein ZWY2020_027985 [Hordeum vulgare]|nr:hypothetical protein ZWY2020_027985 [Hordeum vulgare]